MTTLKHIFKGMGLDLNLVDTPEIQLIIGEIIQKRNEEADNYYLKQVIDHLRYVQIKWEEDKSEISGVDSLDYMVKDGSITLERSLQILPAIQDPHTPYEIRRKK